MYLPFRVQTLNGTQLFIYLCDTKTIKEICMKKEKNFRKDPNQYKVVELFGKNILTLDGNDWSKQRALFNPIFSIDAHLKTVFDCSVKFTHRMEQSAFPNDVNTFEMKKQLHNLTLDVMSYAGFGYDIHCTDNLPMSEFAKEELPEGVTMTLRDSLRASLESLFASAIFGKKFLGMIPFAYPRHLYQSLVDFEKYMDFFLEKYKVVDNSVLDLMIKSHNLELTTDEIKGTMFILYFAGHETTAGTLHWTLLHLAKNPEVQEKLHKEIFSVLQGRDPTYEDLPKLKYALWTLRETLRLSPAVRGIPKTSIKEIEIDGVKFPSNSSFLVFVPAVHQNPSVWKNPEEFNPDRFENYQPESFLPFSFGPRNCIGMKFAEIEGTCILSMLIQKYSFHFKPEISVEDYMKPFSFITTQPFFAKDMIVKKRIVE